MLNRSQVNNQGKNASFKKTEKSSQTLCAFHATEETTEWCVEYTDKFGAWWDTLSEEEQIDVTAVVGLLEKMGPTLRDRHSSKINGSKLSRLRELRIQHAGRPYRVLYAFDPNRTAILLVGGDKTGDNRWYEKNIPVAEAQYAVHLRTLK
ncbi:addiction module toxin RelE [Brasilonema octagenarum UFV-E1]|uniref:Addiction module toxin RelE n=2 Tax=Brasilonema TaxID=383614 RepID=A0A856MJI7_9CYAN|nr:MULTISPECIES: type II toxin-antitoxin system RelE/ParE family toxin [Brasilonema]NMF61349.1 addiction module toxin RelE [Brasilonema octagenarum UFV-OR1]QDL11483.1 addiction module toxin RelE [Brasilonema sennae CENA114]QDL17866.1 addiction module toxin RelE [Brasilonema octagenarum UFV-E1]